MISRAKSFLGARYPTLTSYENSACSLLMVGGVHRSDSIATQLCGVDDLGGAVRRMARGRVFNHCERFVVRGGLSIVAPALARAAPQSFLARTIEVPELIGLTRPLPDTIDAFRTTVRTSTTREDLRRIRKAGFSYRLTKDERALREFHNRYSNALLEKRFPRDGRPDTLDDLVCQLKDGGELLCLDRGGEWLAGIFNTASGRHYALGSLGIRDGSEEIRRMHVASALIVKSCERAIELGIREASLGRSLPFLGKGPVWFKAKWGGVLRLDQHSPRLRMLMDLRSPAVRKILGAQPVLLCEGEDIALAAWQAPGSEALRTTLRDASRFPGIIRRYVLGTPETIGAALADFAANPAIVPIPVPHAAPEPLWLGKILREKPVH